ncbi:MAG: DUF1926 domain-containing protein [Pirellulales bacterium]|nr:DUF1926 domain-containing protein [Pirellulales bacterium]
MPGNRGCQICGFSVEFSRPSWHRSSRDFGAFTKFIQQHNIVMPNQLRLVLALHNHQPVGNFESVFEAAFQDSYRPFLDVFRRKPGMKMSLHTSGCLFDWLETAHPEYLDELSELVSSGRIEILGGAYYEAILPMLSPRDRRDQILTYRNKLEEYFNTSVRGMWVAERVWEQSLTTDIASSGIEYTVLDDFHFKTAGLSEDELHEHYVTEDAGQLLFVFPGNERLRYMIPFADPQETINYLRSIAEAHPQAVVVFADDGEKFGTWPETHKHVYQENWLERFFAALAENSQWLQITTLAEAITNTPPRGKIYLPDCSYREMTEWALPVESQHRLEDTRGQLDAALADELSPFLRGGFWRNFKAKYPEADEMYARMLMISTALQKQRQAGVAETEHFRQAQRSLHMAQCNCAFWHGAFGGIYLPHLRNAVYGNIIAAEAALRELADHQDEAWVDATIDDYNLDARREVRLENERLSVLVSPAQGGWVYELDVFSIRHNLLATLARREEAYHRKILEHQQAGDQDVASIHDRVVFKQPDLHQHLHYDSRPRKSLIDHFYSPDATLQQVRHNHAQEIGDFADGVYEARLRRGQSRVQVELARRGYVGPHSLRLIKRITLKTGQSIIQIAYRLEELPNEPLLFAPEFNFAGLPAGAEDRFFHQGDQRLGQLGHQLDLPAAEEIALCDQWLGIDAQLDFSRAAGLWAFPIQTVSQSEGGFELVHQSVVVQPHWTVLAEGDGAWEVEITLAADTSAAEDRQESQEMAAVT